MACNCLTGTAHEVNGQCLCTNNPDTIIPPQPNTALPVGFQWVYNATANRWIPTRINAVVSQPAILTNNSSVNSITNWIQQHRNLSLAIGAGIIYLFTKKK